MDGNMRTVFVAFVGVGVVMAAVASAVSVPVEDTLLGSALPSTAVSTTEPKWPSEHAVPPGLPLTAFLWLGALLVIGGGGGLVAAPRLPSQPSRLGLALVIFALANLVAAGLGTPPDLTSTALAAIALGLVSALLVVVAWFPTFLWSRRSADKRHR